MSNDLKAWKHKGYGIKWNKEREAWVIYNADHDEEWEADSKDEAIEWIEGTINDNKIEHYPRTELQPLNDSCKSYGHKATIAHAPNGDLYLFSYTTQVASYSWNKEKLIVNGLYSRTTTRHIKEFITQLTGIKYSTAEIKTKFCIN